MSSAIKLYNGDPIVKRLDKLIEIQNQNLRLSQGQLTEIRRTNYILNHIAEGQQRLIELAINELRQLAANNLMKYQRIKNKGINLGEDRERIEKEIQKAREILDDLKSITPEKIQLSLEVHKLSLELLNVFYYQPKRERKVDDFLDKVTLELWQDTCKRTYAIQYAITLKQKYKPIFKQVDFSYGQAVRLYGEKANDIMRKAANKLFNEGNSPYAFLTDNCFLLTYIACSTQKNYQWFFSNLDPKTATSASRTKLAIEELSLAFGLTIILSNSQEKSDTSYWQEKLLDLPDSIRDGRRVRLINFDKITNKWYLWGDLLIETFLTTNLIYHSFFSAELHIAVLENLKKIYDKCYSYIQNELNNIHQKIKEDYKTEIPVSPDVVEVIMIRAYLEHCRMMGNKLGIPNSRFVPQSENDYSALRHHSLLNHMQQSGITPTQAMANIANLPMNDEYSSTIDEPQSNSRSCSMM